MPHTELSSARVFRGNQVIIDGRFAPGVGVLTTPCRDYIGAETMPATRIERSGVNPEHQF